MPLSTLINRPCTLLLRSSDSSGDDGFDRPNTEPEPVETVCELQRVAKRASEESGDAGEVSDTLWVAFFLPGSPAEQLDTGDGLVVDGEEYELVGAPWLARSPRTQRLSHIEVTLRRTAGAGDTGS